MIYQHQVRPHDLRHEKKKSRFEWEKALGRSSPSRHRPTCTPEGTKNDPELLTLPRGYLSMRLRGILTLLLAFEACLPLGLLGLS